MKKTTLLILTLVAVVSCDYHLRKNNALAITHPSIKLKIKPQSVLKRPLVGALIASGVTLQEQTDANTSTLKIHSDVLRKVIQSIGANNQVQEYRLEYDVQYSLAKGKKRDVHLEKDYSFDVQQIGGGQSEETTLRKQLAEDMAWAIIRQINAINNSSVQ